MVKRKLYFELYLSNNRLTIYLNHGVNRILPVAHESFPEELRKLNQELESIKSYARVGIENPELLDLDTYPQWRGKK